MKELRCALDNKLSDLTLIFAPEKRLIMAQLKAAIAKHSELDFFNPSNSFDDDAPLVTVADIRSVRAVRFPYSDFSFLEHDEIALAINAVTSSAISAIPPEEQALGFSTRRKL
jgi:hypothetical protein